MAKEKKEGEVSEPGTPVSKGAVIDYTKYVTLRALETAEHHKKGEVFKAGIVLANKMVSEGTAELVEG